MVNREPETPWKDFVARMKFGVLATAGVFGLITAHVYWVEFSETRGYRDFLGKTPFKNVVIAHMEITPTTMTIDGSFVKTRDCQTVGDPIVQVVVNGLVYPATFSVDELPGTPVSRMVSPEPQVFGKWIITSPIPSPDMARMYRTHNCDGVYQTNEVFERKWGLP